jgi:hypothetical protein
MRRASQRPARRAWKVGRAATVWAVGFTLLSSLAPAALDGRGDSSTATRFLSRPDRPLTHYRAYRRMHARCEKFKQEAWLEAFTELDEHGFRYRILSERGSDYTREKVLRAVLRREQELVAAGDAERATLSQANYEFADGDGADPNLRYVLIKPKRKDLLLVDGRMVLSGDGGELLRVEGRLSKNPSFWVSTVDVVRHYGRLDGVRVPISTESTARIKFAGTSLLQVHYDYESINGEPVSLAARRVLAALR